MGLRGCSRHSRNKSNMADGGAAILNFEKCQCLFIGWRYLNKIGKRNATRPREDTQMPKKEPEINSHDVISRTSGTNVGRFYLSQIWYRVREKKQTTIVAERAKFTYHENSRGLRLLYWISKKMSIPSDWMKIYPLNVVDRCIAATWRWSQVLW